jgi:hypothetical protein
MKQRAQKAQTLIERVGFLDPDRVNSKHDEIQLWVYDNLPRVLSAFSTAGNQVWVQTKKLEFPLLQVEKNFTNIVGFIDLVATGYVTHNNEVIKSYSAALEIKTVIPCIGDLVRQINFYRRHQTTSFVWLVVSPDDRFRKILLEQDIYFFKYPSSSQLFNDYISAPN